MEKLGVWRSRELGEQYLVVSHGCVAIPPSDHAVSRFMNTFDELCRVGGNGAYKAMRGAEHRTILGLIVQVAIGELPTYCVWSILFSYNKDL